uniref:EF-hand domain-containing protein n=2 Tax=Proboscia inermis TaxID=420281 RepID=A0A7S0GCY2_9STRA|mmetsp:Transcript_50489/g.60739  ORF Transcript_50489/g.60739 Transcript_50489/m.60739 type:complete len:173 (-) Transcript_50489:456-974(-)
MRNIVSNGGGSMSQESQRRLSDLLSSIFFAFVRDKSSRVVALELASGFTVLCGGRKSDKLEFAFDLIDDDKDGRLSRRGLWKYLRSFLTVLMSISSASANMTEGHIYSAIDSASTWATAQVFGAEQDKGLGNNDNSSKRSVCFDDFAEWYTQGGYGSIPWLELLDLKKWVLT